MTKYFIGDRYGNQIYLTEERWQHIISRHPELRYHHQEVLETVKRGKRRQQPKDHQSYVYRWPCDKVSPPFNGILVVVAFRFDETMPNNFIVTAWAIMMRD